MRKRHLAGIGAVLLVAFGCLVYAAVQAWEYQTLGGIAVRRHTLRGVVEVRRGDRYVAPFIIDPAAPSVPVEDLRTVRIENLTWGEHGLLAGTVVTAKGKPIRGRLVFGVEILETVEGKRVRDRGLRATVDWPEGTSLPIVLSTDLARPIRNQQTRVHLEPVL